MAIHPKLEFYRFKLNHREEAFKTFRDFAIDELRAGKNATSQKVVEACFKHFIQSLDEEFAKDDRLQKQITLIKKRLVNQHLDKQPKFNSEKNIIYGVINGGPYGRDRILSDVDNQDDSTTLGRRKSVLQYFYFLLYVPADHDEGCFIIHSNGVDESITRIFRNFISLIFKGKNYNKAQSEPFCPKSFQDEFKGGATLKSLTFKTSFVENIHNTDGIKDLPEQYIIKIQAIPKNKKIGLSSASEVLNTLSRKVFGSKSSPKSLRDFEETKVETENPVTNSKKIFDLSTMDSDFVPVVYLNGRITKKNADGTPDFEELEELCMNYFSDEVLPELRPDLNVTRA